MKKVVLQRDFQGQDSWGAFIEQVTIDEDKNLDYRCTKGGNCEYGDWQEWKGEEGALSFIFGEIKPSKALIKALKVDLSKAPELKEGECNMDCY
tara:strand:+ start:789 stop:1070 length:282 start_codon:yes stop_codon:yes gene_type:complete